jgi:hypothetical protein
MRHPVKIRNAPKTKTALAARVPQLEAAQEPSEATETVEEEPERAESPGRATEGAQEGVQRPWWRRVFGR